MRFGSQVVEFTYQGIPMVGNTDNGYLIGLTQEGSEVCSKMIETSVPEGEIRAVDEGLYAHLQRGGGSSTRNPLAQASAQPIFISHKTAI